MAFWRVRLARFSAPGFPGLSSPGCLAFPAAYDRQIGSAAVSVQSQQMVSVMLAAKSCPPWPKPPRPTTPTDQNAATDAAPLSALERSRPPSVRRSSLKCRMRLSDSVELTDGTRTLGIARLSSACSYRRSPPAIAIEACEFATTRAPRQRAGRRRLWDKSQVTAAGGPPCYRAAPCPAGSVS
jgi:hypothetical protein